MEWCGRTPSSFVKSPAECSCIFNQEARGLQPDEQRVLLKQSDLITFGKEALKITHKVNQGQALRQLGIGEDPRKSRLWDFDFMKPNQ